MQLNEQIRLTLVKMADQLDRDGKHDLAEKIDEVLTSKAARPKAPLKGLKDDVKKNLVMFLMDASKNNQSSADGLNELFRRMRYFDIADSIKDLGLDKVVKEMNKTQECLDNASKSFYAMTFGKNPSKDDITKLLEELGKGDDSDDGQAALDFFDAHSDTPFPYDTPTDEPNEEDEPEEAPKDESEEDVSEEDYDAFFEGLDNEEAQESFEDDEE